MRRTGFIATLAAGFALVAASLHGMTSVDTTLKVAAAKPAAQPELVRESHPRRDCDRPRERGPAV
jgi:F0F1-type ATP synthase membrane subunit c/vacuolar-type H+-ATPase subunit K